MSKWRPIETAPKDGTEIIVVNGAGRGLYTEAGRIGIAAWQKQAFPAGKMTWCATDCCDGVTTYAPTHWMPLPEPPK